MAEYNGSIELISGLIQKNNADFPLMEASAVAFYETVQDADGVISTKEIRLPDKLKEVGISEKDKAQIVIDAVAAADSALIADDAQVGAKIATNATEINKLKGTVSDLASQIQKDNPNLRIFYDKKESFLYLYDDPGDEQGLIKPNPETGDKGNTISYTEILGGGGGQSLPLRLSLKVLNKNQQIILNGKSAELKFRAEMFKTDVEPETEVSKNLTFKLSVTSESRGTLTTSFVKSTNNDHSFDVTPYLGLGDNEITLSASYTEDKKTEEGEIIPVTLFASNYWTIKVIELYIDDTDFTDSTAFIDKSATWSGLVYGDVNKTIHYKLNGQDDWKTESNIFTDGYSASMTIPFQSHGVSTLEVYLTTQIDDTPEGLLRSDSKFYELLFINSSDPTPVLRLTATPNPMQQYTAGTLSYTVYSNQELMKDVTLIEGQNNIIFSGRISNATQNQSYTFMDAGEKNIKLSYNFDNQEYSKEITVLVEESEYQIGPITAGLVLDFLPTGRSNDAHDYNVFYNNAEKLLDKETASALPDINWSFSDNFDWYNGGWQVDDEGNTYFCVKAGTSVTIDYDPFDDDAMITQGATLGRGKEFKLIFKTTNVGKSDATFLTCLDKNNVGLQMNVHEAYINSNESSLYSPYSEEDIIEFDFNIFPGVNKNGTELLPSGDIIPMLMTYEDGVPFRPLIHTLSTSYAHANKSNIVIGSTDCDVHIYRMKTYDRYLKDSDVLKNFIADARNGSEMVDRHKRNLIYKSGKLTPNSLAEARPDLKIIKITCPKFTNSKSDFVPMTSVEMIHKNGDPYKDNWKFENCFLVGQGTTSNKYRDAGKNLELICSFDGEYYNKKVLQSEYFNNDKAKYYAYKTKLTLNPNDKTNKKDNSYDATLDENPGDGKIALYEDAYPNNYFNIKVNIASSDNANNALQANRYDRYMPYTTPAEKRDSRDRKSVV